MCWRGRVLGHSVGGRAPVRSTHAPGHLVGEHDRRPYESRRPPGPPGGRGSPSFISTTALRHYGITAFGITALRHAASMSPSSSFPRRGSRGGMLVTHGSSTGTTVPTPAFFAGTMAFGTEALVTLHVHAAKCRNAECRNAECRVPSAECRNAECHSAYPQSGASGTTRAHRGTGGVGGFDSVAQLAEAAVSETAQCRFESCRSHCLSALGIWHYGTHPNAPMP